MAAPGTRTREAAPKESWSITGMVGDWIRQGAEGFIATQKILLDLAAQQNALALTIARERLGMIAPFPTKAMVDLTSGTFHNFIEAQQVVLDVAAKENDIIAEGVKPKLSNTPVEGLAEVVHQGLANIISAQKSFLTLVDSETEGAAREYEAGKSFDTAHLSTVAREGARNFIHSQKKFLDIVEEQLLNESEMSDTKAETAKPASVFDLAKDSVDAYVEAQKRLLDVAAGQIDVNVKFVRDLFSMDIQKKPATTIPDVLKKSADSFVAAQKALVELASKPRKLAPERGKAAPEIVIASA